MTSATSTIRVAVVDDHPVFRLGMVALLETLHDVEVVAEAASAAEAARLPADSIDVVVMDLQLGDGSGVETTRDLLRRAPRLRALVVTMHEDDESVVASIRAGARGYLLKGATPDEVERALRAGAASGRQRRGDSRSTDRRTRRQPPDRRPTGRPASVPATHRPRTRGARPARPRLRHPVIMAAFVLLE